jgi:hypothetical protein
MFWRANLAWKTSKPDLLLTSWMQCFLPDQFKELETLSHGSIPGPSMVSMNCNRVATRVASIHSIAHISLWKQESMLMFFNWCLWLLNGWWLSRYFWYYYSILLICATVPAVSSFWESGNMLSVHPFTRCSFCQFH